MSESFRGYAEPTKGTLRGYKAPAQGSFRGSKSNPIQRFHMTVDPDTHLHQVVQPPPRELPNIIDIAPSKYKTVEVPLSQPSEENFGSTFLRYLMSRARDGVVDSGLNPDDVTKM